MQDNDIDILCNNINDINLIDDNLDVYYKLSAENRLKLIDKLKYIKNENVGIYLNRIYQIEEDKNIQKQIRKVLFVLKSAGIKIDEPEIKGESALKKIEGKKTHIGLITNYDDQNTMIAIIAFEIKRNNFIFIDTTIEFSSGLKDLGFVPLDKKGLDDVIRGLKADAYGEMAIADISPRYAYYIMEEASARSGKFKQEVKSLSNLIKSITSGVQKPEDIYKLPIPDTTHSLSLEQILTHPFFEPFILTWEGIEEDKRLYNEIGKTSIVLPPYMINEKKNAFLDSLITSDKLKNSSFYIKRMLENYAYIFHFYKEYPYYKGLIEILGQEEAIKEAIFYFVEIAMEDTEDKKEGGLILNPYE